MKKLILAILLAFTTIAVKAETLTATLEQHYWKADVINTDSLVQTVWIPPANTMSVPWFQLKTVTSERWAKDAQYPPVNVTSINYWQYFVYPYPNATFLQQQFTDTLTKNWNTPNFATAVCTTQLTTTHPLHTPSGPTTSPAGTESINIGLLQRNQYYTHQSIYTPGITDYSTYSANGRLRVKLSGFIAGHAYKITLKLLPIQDQITGATFGPQLFRINTTTAVGANGLSNQVFPSSGVLTITATAPANGCWDVTPTLISNPLYYHYYYTGKMTVQSVVEDK